MKNRKRIGVMITNPEATYQQRIIDGIMIQCARYGYDAVVFSSLVDIWHPQEEYLRSELNIWELANFDKLDGVLVTSITMTKGTDRSELEGLCDMIHRKNVYVSVDVFGESSYGYVTSYGQYWPAMSNIVDVISSMPYTDHFSFNDEDSYLWENPYNTVYNWAVGAAGLQKTIATPAIARTWITGWDVPYWNPTTYCGPDYLAAQAQALWDAGLTGGFMAWNIACDPYRYDYISWAWAKDYAHSDGTIYRR